MADYTKDDYKRQNQELLLEIRVRDGIINNLQETLIRIEQPHVHTMLLEALQRLVWVELHLETSQDVSDDEFEAAMEQATYALAKVGMQ